MSTFNSCEYLQETGNSMTKKTHASNNVFINDTMQYSYILTPERFKPENSNQVSYGNPRS